MNYSEIRLREQITNLIDLTTDIKEILTTGSKWKRIWRISLFTLNNYEEIEMSISELKLITIPEEPEKLHAFVLTFNGHFDLKNDLLEEQVEETLLLLVAIKKYINLFL